MMRFNAKRLCLLVAGALVAAPLAFAPAAHARGPEAIADLAAEVSDAVVNIATATNVGAGRPTPGLPDRGERGERGGPPSIEEFFEEFFGRRGQRPPGEGGPPQTERPTPGEPPQGRTPQRRQSSLGSGFVIEFQNGEGIIITNNHVIDGADEINAVFNDGTRLRAELIGRDQRTDIAVLKVRSTKPLKVVRFGDSERLRVGEWVVAIGNPFGLGGSVSAGIVSARNRDIQAGPYDNFIQTDAAINRGNSGGPLFNLRGEVIGINTAIISPTGGSIGIGFAVPAATAMPVIEQLRRFGETRRGWLGVRIQQVTDELADSLQLGTPRGALVGGVDDRGPAKPAGIEVGDVILKFDGRDIKEMRDLPRIVADTMVGKEVDVVVFRRGREVALKVTLGRLEETDRRAAAARPGVEPPRPAVTRALGMELSGITEELRRRFEIRESIKGVVVTGVEGGSVAAERRIAVGDVIVEIAQQPVGSPTEVTERLEALKREGRRSALLLVANKEGDLRFVALSLQ